MSDRISGNDCYCAECMAKRAKRMAIITSYNLIIAAQRAAHSSLHALERAALVNTEDLATAEAKLVEALVDVRIARFGIHRKNPNFDAVDLAILIDKEVTAIREAKGYARYNERTL